MTSADVNRSEEGVNPLIFYVASTVSAAVGLSVALVMGSQGVALAVSVLACLIVTIPLGKPNYRLISAWSLLVVVVYIGAGLRGIFIAFDLDGGTSTIENLFLRGSTLEDFIPEYASYLVALLALSVAYSVGLTVGRPLSRKVTTFSWAPYAGLVILVFAVLGAVAFLLYVRATVGGLGISTLSAKRSVVGVDGSVEGYSNFGVLRAMATFSSVAFWCHSARLAGGELRGVAPRLCNIALGLNAIALPFFDSQRTAVVSTLLVGMAIHLALGVRKKVLRTAVRWGVPILALLAVTTGLRAQAQGYEKGSSGFASLLDGLVFNRNFADPFTVAHILRAVPVDIPYMHGETILRWLVAPVPRSIWPDKPVLSVGQLIGSTVFDLGRSGVPPGLIGELYLNGGVILAMVGGAVIGYLLARLLDSKDYARRGQRSALVYCAVGVPLGSQIFVSSIGQALFNAAVTFTMMSLALRLMGRNIEK